MTADELRTILAQMEPETKDAMKKKIGADQMDDDKCVYAIAEAVWEGRFCQALGQPTEAGRVAMATFEAAWYAKAAFIATLVLGLIGIALTLSKG